MSIFKKEVIPAPEISGTDVLRRTLRAWSNKPAVLHAIARDVDGVGVGMLEDFASGRIDLSTEVLQRLVKVMHGGHAVFDPESGMLKSAYADRPTRSYTAPDPYRPPADFVIARPTIGPQPAEPPTTRVTNKRDGWLGKFFPTPVEPPVVQKRREPFVRLRET
ncbi:hypothetical protein G6321_00017155 [Bradyrhizobium barranii subsp. barranii]|uniref:Uncharacterized protein n=1 Tax=Bradyrhizobium barranii subsp. barranii TaxID=2823807 RepID=A0A7Z0Q4F1_9BRAD|nr:hypothetical protein [Bradyrhizobium barranii]UGX96771.1 hypothetical protein G6321_00017155 [Bradyrhizobium barranii subsp. barranii]